MAFFATDVFRRINGRRFEVEADEAHQHLIGLLESGLADYEHLLDWILRNTVPHPS